MKLRKNIFDLILLGITVMAMVVFFFPKQIGNVSDLELMVKIPKTEAINEIKKDDEIFLNSTNEPVIISDYQTIGGDILITLAGQGIIEENRYIFNGQRVLVGQKAELHGKFWAQGIITEVKYAD